MTSSRSHVGERERVQRHIASPSLSPPPPSPKRDSETAHSRGGGRKKGGRGGPGLGGRTAEQASPPSSSGVLRRDPGREGKEAGAGVPSCAEELPGALRVRGAATRLRGPRVGRCRDRTPHERCCQIGLPLAWHSLSWRGSMWQRCC